MSVTSAPLPASASPPDADAPSPEAWNGARLAAIQALYQIELTSDPVDCVITDFVSGRTGGRRHG